MKLIIILVVITAVECENKTRRKFDAFVQKLEDEFPGYEGRPMPKELQEMITVHKKMNDDIEECMYDFSECMAVKKSYPFCGLQIASEKRNTTQNVTRWFKNLCEFAYRECRDGERSWISIPNSQCSGLEPITEDADQSNFYDHGHQKELDSFDIPHQDQNPTDGQNLNQEQNLNQNQNSYQNQNPNQNQNPYQNQNPNQNLNPILNQNPNQNQNQDQNLNQDQNQNPNSNQTQNPPPIQSQNQNPFLDQPNQDQNSNLNPNQAQNANQNLVQTQSLMLRNINAKINKYTQSSSAGFKSPVELKLSNDKQNELTNLLSRVQQILV